MHKFLRVADPEICAILPIVFYNTMCYNNYRKREVFIMEKVKIDFGKSYERQSKKAKSMLCKHDFYEIKNLLIFKNNLKKALTN